MLLMAAVGEGNCMGIWKQVLFRWERVESTTVLCLNPLDKKLNILNTICKGERQREHTIAERALFTVTKKFQEREIWRNGAFKSLLADFLTKKGSIKSWSYQCYISWCRRSGLILSRNWNTLFRNSITQCCKNKVVWWHGQFHLPNLTNRLSKVSCSGFGKKKLGSEEHLHFSANAWLWGLSDPLHVPKSSANLCKDASTWNLPKFAEFAQCIYQSSIVLIQSFWAPFPHPIHARLLPSGGSTKTSHIRKEKTQCSPILKITYCWWQQALVSLKLQRKLPGFTCGESLTTERERLGDHMIAK